MQKTKRDLLYELADKIGGEYGEGMRAWLQKKAPFDDILDRPMSDEELARQMKMLEDVPQTLAKLKKMKKTDWAKPATWRFFS